MKKVLHVITSMDQGGAQINTVETCRRMDRDRFTPVLVTGHGRLNPHTALARVYRIPSLRRRINPLADAAALLDLVCIIRKELPDVVHTHCPKAGILGRLAAHLSGRFPKVVHTHHGFGHNPDMSWPARRLLVGAERRADAWTDRHVFVSRANQRQAQVLGICDWSKSTVIRSGIDLNSYRNDPDKRATRDALGLNHDMPVVVTVGNDKPQKNYPAFRRMADALWPIAQFVAVGGDRVERDGPVHRLGWRDDVPDILAASDIFVLLSKWEGLPRSLLEAMASSLPAVCYPVDGIAEVLEDGLTGFTANHEVSAQHLVRELLRNPLTRRNMGQYARARLGDPGGEFSLRAMVQQLQELYVEVLNQENRRLT